MKSVAPGIVTISQPGFGIIKAVSGRGVRWGASRHQDGLGPFPQGRGRSLLSRSLPLSAVHLCPRHQNSQRNRLPVMTTVER